MDLVLGEFHELVALRRLMSWSERRGTPGFSGAVDKYSDWTDASRPHKEPGHTHEKKCVKSREMVCNKKLQTKLLHFPVLKQSQEHREGSAAHTNELLVDPGIGDRTDVSHHKHCIGLPCYNMAWIQFDVRMSRKTSSHSQTYTYISHSQFLPSS